MHRHPCIFKWARRLTAAEKSSRVLSFGCSSGEEVRTLKEIGNPHWIVHGLELKQELVSEARLADPTGVYVTSVQDLCPESYDVVFCMSVLCRFPDGTFTFSEFQKAAEVVCSLVAPGGGLLVLYNAQYDLRDIVAPSSVCLDFEPIENIKIHGGSGFVPKMRSDGTHLKETEGRNVPLIFRRKEKTT